MMSDMNLVKHKRPLSGSANTYKIKETQQVIKLY